MNKTVLINNCGTYLKKEKEELCKLLLKKATEIWYASRPRRFNSELDVLITCLYESDGIQIYKTGVVRIFLNHDRLEERDSIILRKLPIQILDILKE